MRLLEKHAIWKMLLLKFSAVIGPHFFSWFFFAFKSKFCLQYLIISGKMSQML